MDLTTERNENVLSLDVTGRIDGSTAVAFEEAVRNAIDETDRALIMDFGGLDYISSAGLRVILLTAKSLQSQDAKLVLALSPSRFERCSRSAGSTSFFPFTTPGKKRRRLSPADPAERFRPAGAGSFRFPFSCAPPARTLFNRTSGLQAVERHR